LWSRILVGGLAVAACLLVSISVYQRPHTATLVTLLSPG
jgi:hypothetical protein